MYTSTSIFYTKINGISDHWTVALINNNYRLQVLSGDCIYMGNSGYFDACFGQITVIASYLQYFKLPKFFLFTKKQSVVGHLA